jgi:hypothetical protein
LVKKISQNLSKFFEAICDYPEVTKLSISALIGASKRVDDVIAKLQATSKITAYTSLQLNLRVCKALEELFEIWVTTDDIASFVAFDVDGFEYLIDKIRLGSVIPSSAKPESSSSSQPSMDSESSSSTVSTASLLQGSDLFEQVTKFREEGVKEGGESGSIGAPQKSSSASANAGSEELREEDFATKLAIINQKDQTWSGITPDWSINKKGVRARILYFVMQGSSYNEYQLVFNLEKTVEIKQIRIGFNTVWTDYSDKVLGVPSSVIVEGGRNKDEMSHLATLTPVNDEGYVNFSVKVFQKNFQRFENNTKKNVTLEELVQTLATKRVSVLRFRFRRPTVTFVESLSMLTGKTYKNVAVSISFISINGYDVNRLPNIRKKLSDAQEASSLVNISRLCNNQFGDTLNVLANKPDVVNKIKGSFDGLTNLLVPHEGTLNPVILALASHNQELGDWIMGKFLDINRSKEHAKLIG